MTYEPGAEYAAWMDAYQLCSAAADKVRTTPCPHCARMSLNLIYVVPDEAAESGTAVFWCDHCLFGLTPLNAPVPPRGTKVMAGTEDVPDYSLVVDDSEPIE